MDYIMGAYNSEGVNALVTITVTELNKSDFGYDSFYAGILEMGKLKKSRDWVEVPIIDNDVISRFKARDEMELSLPALQTIDGSTITEFTNGFTKTVNIEGVNIVEMLSAEIISNVSIDWTTEPPTGITILANEIGANETTLDYENQSGGNEIFNLYAEATIDYDLDFDLNEFATSVTVDIYMSFDFNGVQKRIVEHQITVLEDGNETGSITSSISEVDQILADGNFIEDLKIVTTVTISGDIGKDADITGSITIADGLYNLEKRKEAYPVTAAKLLFPDEAIQRALEQMTGAKPFRSDEVGRTDSENHTYAADGDLSLIALGNGANIRGFNQTEMPFVTTFKKLFHALNMFKPIGLWYSYSDERWELNEIKDFYKDSEILDIGKVKNLEISVDEQYYFNTIKIGYQEELDYEDINGNQNFAVLTNYSTGVKRIKGEKDLTSPYRYDDYGIELTRRESNKEKYGKSLDADSDNFMLYTQRNGGIFITVQGTDSFSVIRTKAGGRYLYSSRTRLNLDLAPKRCMMRHISILGTVNYKDSSPIRFLNSQYNLDLGLKKSDEASVIYESDDITNTELEEPLFYPEIYNFEAPVTASILDQLFSDPHGYITFEYNNTEYKGFIVEVSTEPFSRRGNWTLIKYNDNR
jgi:hypothetical protein